MVCVTAADSRLIADHVALEIECNIHGFPVLNGFATPDRLIVLFETADVRIAMLLDLLARLTFGEAVLAGYRSGACFGITAIRGDRRWRRRVVRGRRLCNDVRRQEQRKACDG